jgi:hypothetical protein
MRTLSAALRLATSSCIRALDSGGKFDLHVELAEGFAGLVH